MFWKVWFLPACVLLATVSAKARGGRGEVADQPRADHHHQRVTSAPAADSEHPSASNVPWAEDARNATANNTKAEGPKIVSSKPESSEGEIGYGTEGLCSGGLPRDKCNMRYGASSEKFLFRRRTIKILEKKGWTRVDKPKGFALHFCCRRRTFSLRPPTSKPKRREKSAGSKKNEKSAGSKKSEKSVGSKKSKKQQENIKKDD